MDDSGRPGCPSCPTGPEGPDESEDRDAWRTHLWNPHLRGRTCLVTESCPRPKELGLLPWSWAVERLTRSHDYWLSTVRPDARPHAMPVWAVWLENALWFSSGGSSRKARNLALNPWVVITTDDALEPVVVEGQAADREPGGRYLRGGEVRRSLELQIRNRVPGANSSWTTRVSESLRHAVYGLTEADFTGSPTRWTFD